MTAPTIDTAELVREHRFDELVRNEQARIVRTIFRFCGNWADAEEAVQEALVKVWAVRAQLDHVDNLAAWLVIEAKWKARKLAAQRRQAVPGLLGEHIERVEAQTPEPSSLPCAADPEVKARIRVALAAMSPMQRAVVQAHCIHGLTIEETAKKVGTTRRSVSQMLYMALHHVDLSGPEWRDHIAEIGLESPEAKAFRTSFALVRMLPTRQRQAVRLRYLKRLPLADVAREMHSTPTNVRNLLNDARRTVRALAADLTSGVGGPR
ncbi:sigma-70 family RNA polymerase sigma factor [Micromonospora sp. WMMD1274]|uniref:sigma-70 family RNA polymerase sigma factor n=1 Tax=Micromonospora sp. WMMD1274 TaxID=3404116 RepID=UPI003B9223B0